MTENTTPQVPENAPVPGKIQDHFELFHTEQYQDLFEYKRQFEGAHDRELVAETAEWTKSWEYREKNFCPGSPHH
jgi:nitrogenase molybdenum-iron protein beta chain